MPGERGRVSMRAISRSGWFIGILFCLVRCPGVSPVYGQPPTSSQAASRLTTTRAAKPRLPKGFAAKKITMPDGSVRKYALFVPPQYKLHESHKWPLILALHGSGECGKDGVKQTTIGLAPHIVSRPTKFPFIVIFPQAHKLWFRGDEEIAVWLELEATLKDYRVDPDRVYLTGLSMGGFATWEMAAARPDIFAAIVPICGAGPLGYMSNLVNMPIWAFHGALDKNVPVARSRELIDELKRLGGKPHYTEYPNLEHDSWSSAYATPELWRWLLKQRRPAEPPRVIDYYLSSERANVWWLMAEAEPRPKEAPHIRVEIGEDGRLSVESKHVTTWAVTGGPDPLQPGKNIDVAWNGQPVYQGEFNGMIGFKQEASTQSVD